MAVVFLSKPGHDQTLTYQIDFTSGPTQLVDLTTLTQKIDFVARSAYIDLSQSTTALTINPQNVGDTRILAAPLSVGFYPCVLTSPIRFTANFPQQGQLQIVLFERSIPGPVYTMSTLPFTKVPLIGGIPSQGIVYVDNPATGDSLAASADFISAPLFSGLNHGVGPAYHVSPLPLPQGIPAGTMMHLLAGTSEPLSLNVDLANGASTGPQTIRKWAPQGFGQPPQLSVLTGGEIGNGAIVTLMWDGFSWILQPLTDCQAVPAWNTIATLLNGWVAASPSTMVQWASDRGLVTYLRGQINSGTSANGTQLFSIPASVSPSATQTVPVFVESGGAVIQAGFLQIGSGGAVTCQGFVGNLAVIVDCSFPSF